jgi:hypothetical protein
MNKRGEKFQRYIAACVNVTRFVITMHQRRKQRARKISMPDSSLLGDEFIFYCFAERPIVCDLPPTSCAVCNWRAFSHLSVRSTQKAKRTACEAPINCVFFVSAFAHLYTSGAH